MLIFKNISVIAKAIIFDFDGVIVDTEPLHYRAFQKILEPRGLGFTWKEYVDDYMGFDDRDAFKEAFASRDMPADKNLLTELIAEKAEIFHQTYEEGITAYPGVVELIKKLNAAGIPLAICSGALRSDIIPILEILGISDCFDCIVTADDVARSKPDPECYKIAFDQLSAIQNDAEITKDKTYAIEDTPAGINAALSAGLRAIAVTNSYPDKFLTNANHIVTSLEYLLEFEKND